MNTHSLGPIGGVSAARIGEILDTERATYAAARPRSRALIGQGAEGYWGGVPMHWMRDWPMPFPFVVANANGATLTDVDGISLADFCLGDTGSMFGHSPPPVARAIARQASAGLTYMLPTEDTIAVGKLLKQRFGLPHWQIATTATDANRFALRVARAATGRAKILVFNGCYHGTVDETFLRLDASGRPIPRPGLLGQVVDLAQTTRIVEFNDLPALEAALAHGDVACVIAEPVMTNCCMVLPDDGFHTALRRLTREAGTLLLIDETHTISTGPGGYTRWYGLDPDLFVLGKPVAGGIPASVWGFTNDVARRLDAAREANPGFSGMGTTLSANPLALAAMRANLTDVMTDAAFAHMDRLAGRLADGLDAAVAASGLPWHVVRVGARVEFICAPGPLRNGTQAEAAHAGPLEQAIHLSLLNAGCLIAPFHNMMLVSPATMEVQVDRLVRAFAAVTARLVA